MIVFDSTIEVFLLRHLDSLAESRDFPPGPAELQPLPDQLVWQSRALLASIKN